MQRAIGDQCQYGLKAKDGNQEGPARKSTGFLTNSPCIAKQLCKRCPNRSGQEIHKHIRLEAGRAGKAQVYPNALCEVICKGIRDQFEADRAGQFFTMSVMNGNNTTSKDLDKERREMEDKYKIVEEDDPEEIECAWDDVSGAALDPQKVKQARREEIEYVRKMSLYKKVPVKEGVARTGRQPISVRWIDINKGDSTNPNYRSRLVAGEINTHKREDLFAATPPLEALKTIVSMTTTANKGEVLMINDISRAFFHAKVKRDVYVQLAEEDKVNGEEHMRGKIELLDVWYTRRCTNLVRGILGPVVQYRVCPRQSNTMRALPPSASHKDHGARRSLR